MDIRKHIVETINVKASIKQKVYDSTDDCFKLLKIILEKMPEEYNIDICVEDVRVKMHYRDNGAFESELKVAGDLLILSMHSNIFEFNREHSIWKLEYVKKDILKSYTGIINIYNFLADSFKYNRMEDLGYLIGRIFINMDGCFFVEGKRQLGFPLKDFGKKKIDKESLTHIINTAIKYALDFDLLVPPYEQVMVASVQQMTQKITHSKMKTGKRLGFKFKSDDVQNKLD